MTRKENLAFAHRDKEDRYPKLSEAIANNLPGKYWVISPGDYSYKDFTKHVIFATDNFDTLLKYAATRHYLDKMDLYINQKRHCTLRQIETAL